MIKVVSKGYTITVTSWENDADNYNTKSVVTDSKEMAKAYYDMMQLCRSRNGRKDTIGNVWQDFSKQDEEIIAKFLKANPIILQDDIKKVEEEDRLTDYFVDIAHELMGSGEFLLRVAEKCTVIYSDKEIFVEEIKF